MLLVWQSSKNRKSYDAPHQANFRKQEILRCSDGLGRKQYEEYKYDVSQLQGKQEITASQQHICFSLFLNDPLNIFKNKK